MSDNWQSEGKAVVTAEAGTTPEFHTGHAAWRARLDYHLIRSILWSAGSDWGTQIFGWIAFVWVMRLVTPGDFGIVGMANILMPYMGQLTGLGLPRAVVALPHLTEEQLSQMNTLSLMSATALFLLGVIFAKSFAAFFKTPALAPVFIVACSGLILSASCAVPAARLTRYMRFRLLAVLGIGCTLISAAATLGLALLGFGYWALLLGNMIAGIFRAVMILRARPTKLVWPRYRTIREPVRFGWQISISVVAMNSYQRLDNFVAGKMLGSAALGFYAQAWEIANVPLEKIVSLVTVVIPAYLAAVQDQPEKVRRYLRVLTEMIALAAFPATIGVALVAPEAVPVIFGHKWDPMVAPLQVLSFYAAFRSVVALLSKVMVAIGRVRYVMWNDLAALVILPTAFYFGSRRGTTGIAWAWVVAYPLVIFPLYRETFRAVGMTVGEYLQALRPALTSTATMVPAVVLLRHRMAPMHSLLLRLIIEVVAGLIVYSSTLWLFHKDRAVEIVERIKGIWKQRTYMGQTTLEEIRNARVENENDNHFNESGLFPEPGRD
jgi:teichuronic acid exporter